MDGMIEALLSVCVGILFGGAIASALAKVEVTKDCNAFGYFRYGEEVYECRRKQ
jgi:hypothetical protein